MIRKNFVHSFIGLLCDGKEALIHRRSLLSVSIYGFFLLFGAFKWFCGVIEGSRVQATLYIRYHGVVGLYSAVRTPARG